MNTEPDPNQPAMNWPHNLDESHIQALGQSLRRIDTGLMKAGEAQVGQRVWYQGSEPYFDVVLEVQENDDIRWCQFTLRGKVLLWSSDPARLQTGETEEFDVPPTLAYYAASKTIRDGAEVDRAFVHLVSSILKSRPDDPLLQEMGKFLAQSTL